MKKIPKKAKYTVGIIFLAILLIADAKCSQSVKENAEREKSESVEQSNVPDELESEEPEPCLETFEELQDDNDKEVNGNGKTVDEIDNTIEDTEEENSEPGQVSSSKGDNADSSVENQAVIIDESGETMRDETEGSGDEEYDANQEPQGKVDLSSPQKSERELGGREVH